MRLVKGIWSAASWWSLVWGLFGCGADEGSSQEANGAGTNLGQANEEHSTEAAGGSPKFADLAPEAYVGEYCARAAAMVCPLMETCCSILDASCTVKLEGQCLESHERSGETQVQLDVNAADECFSHLAASIDSCESVEFSEACTRTWVGAVAPGAVCESSFHCAPQAEGSVWCGLGASSSERICQTVPWLSEGESCGRPSEGQCEAGLFCSDSTGRCEQPLSLGSPCSGNFECASGNCEMGMCRSPADFTEGCQSLRLLLEL